MQGIKGNLSAAKAGVLKQTLRHLGLSELKIQQGSVAQHIMKIWSGLNNNNNKKGLWALVYQEHIKLLRYRIFFLLVVSIKQNPKCKFTPCLHQ